MESLKVEIRHIGDNIDQFFEFIDRPFWFKLYLKPYFETQRLKMHGTLFMAKNSQDPDSPVVGCIYCELEPNHLTYGKNLPIFGWVQANSEEILHFLFKHLEKYVKDHGYDEIRGPINPPKLFGGWGTMTKGFDQPLLIDSAKNDPNLVEWIKNAGYKPETEYVSLQTIEPLNVPNPFPDRNIELISLPIDELGKRRTLTSQLREFVMKNFVGNLPDSSLAEKKHEEIFQILGMVPNGELYYLIAYDHDEQRVIGLIIEIPNIYETWMGKKIFTTNVNTVIVAKKYRNHQLFHWIYSKIFNKLKKNGIKIHIGGTVWTKNVPALTSFIKISKEVARFVVFQKKL
jgi:hypothetical protein